MGTENVPTMYELEKYGKPIKDLMGDTTRMFKTSTGHIYYVNDIATVLKQVGHLIICLFVAYVQF